MKITLFIFLFVLVGVGLIFVWGTLLPKAHETRISREFPAPAETIFAKTSDFKSYPNWRTGTKSVSVEASDRFIEDGANGVTPYRVTVFERPKKIVTQIDDSSLPYSGTWTFEVSIVDDNRSLLTITENGQVPNPFFRFASRYIFTHEKTILVYLADLGKLVGQ